MVLAYYSTPTVMNYLNYILANDIFKISPKKAIIPAEGACPFEVMFSPKEASDFYSRILSAQIYWPKYNLSKEILHVPWSISLYLLGK